MPLAWWEVVDNHSYDPHHMVETCRCAHSGVWILLCSPRVLCTITQLESPKELIFFKYQFRAPARDSDPTTWNRVQVYVIFKTPQEILICPHRWKPLASKPYQVLITKLTRTFQWESRKAEKGRCSITKPRFTATYIYGSPSLSTGCMFQHHGWGPLDDWNYREHQTIYIYIYSQKTVYTF